MDNNKSSIVVVRTIYDEDMGDNYYACEITDGKIIKESYGHKKQIKNFIVNSNLDKSTPVFSIEEGVSERIKGVKDKKSIALFIGKKLHSISNLKLINLTLTDKEMIHEDDFPDITSVSLDWFFGDTIQEIRTAMQQKKYYLLHEEEADLTDNEEEADLTDNEEEADLTDNEDKKNSNSGYWVSGVIGVIGIGGGITLTVTSVLFSILFFVGIGIGVVGLGLVVGSCWAAYNFDNENRGGENEFLVGFGLEDQSEFNDNEIIDGSAQQNKLSDDDDELKVEKFNVSYTVSNELEGEDKEPYSEVFEENTPFIQRNYSHPL